MSDEAAHHDPSLNADSFALRGGSIRSEGRES